ncbi:unnamed protein product [Cuscuta campestris]|uniref:Uncharacterized protein n=1 Tax=Cuscuta campestris TaxID=132261 RepID=A0A484NGV9_9ASTE|nr:unnamed protein product [Cuscuta campestris]
MAEEKKRTINLFCPSLSKLVPVVAWEDERIDLGHIARTFGIEPATLKLNGHFISRGVDLIASSVTWKSLLSFFSARGFSTGDSHSDALTVDGKLSKLGTKLMSDREDSQNSSVHSYGSGDRSQTSSSSSSSSSERPATSQQRQPVDAPTGAPSSSAAQVVSVAQPGDEGFIQLDDQLLQEQPSYMQKVQVHELRNLMPDGDLGEFSIHPFKVLFLETYRIMPGQMAPNGHPFPFAQNVRGKRMKRQVKPAETDDLVAWETTLRAGDASTRGLYNVGKCSVYPGRETDPELEIVLAEAIPNAIPIHRVRGSKAPVTAAADPSRPGKKKKEKVVKFQSKFATPKIVVEEPSTAQPLSQPSSQPFLLEEQPAQSQQGTSRPIHSGELYINVDTLEFDNMLAETGHTSEAETRKRRRAEVVDQPAKRVAQSSDVGQEPGEPRSFALMVRSDEELFQAFQSDLQEVGRIGLEYFTRLVKSRDEEKAWLEAMMVECWKDAQAAHAKAEKAEEKLVEHCAVYRQLYAKHDGLLKATKEADAQAQEKIQQLEADNAQSAEEIARLGDKLAKERAERAALAAAWVTQEPEEFTARALPDRETAIRFFQGLYKHNVSAGIVDEIGTYGFESGQYDERRALYGILGQRIQGFQPKALSLPELHDEAPVPPFLGI